MITPQTREEMENKILSLRGSLNHSRNQSIKKRQIIDTLTFRLKRIQREISQMLEHPYSKGSQDITIKELISKKRG